MAARKIRLTLSSDLLQNTGAIVDLDFAGDSLELDLAINETAGTGVAREYSVDLPNGTYDLVITYKNDEARDMDLDGSLDGAHDQDRNLVIENIEYSNDGVNYEQLDITTDVPDGAIGTYTGYELPDGSTLVEQYAYPLRMWQNGTATFDIFFS